MNTWFWIAVILTSPFWMVLGMVLVAGIVSIFEAFFKLFRRIK